MAKNKPYGDGARRGEVKNRKQVFNPHNNRWTEIHTETNKFINQMARKNKPFKGVRKVK
jgi:hypothetical protein